MEKDNKFKLKLPRFFTSSCKTQDLSEVIDHQNPIFTPQNTVFLNPPLMEVTQDQDNNNNNNLVLSPVTKPKLKPSLSQSSSSSMMYCKPRCPETFDQMVRENCIIATAGNPPPRRKIAGGYLLLSSAGDYYGGGRRKCPPVSPESLRKQGRKTRKKKKKNKNNLKGIKNSKNESALLKKIENPNQILYYSSNETDDIGDWFSSDDEREMDETETLFSLKSLSFSSKSISFCSDDDDSRPARARTRVRPVFSPKSLSFSSKSISFSSDDYGRDRARPRRRKADSEVGVVPLEGKVKDTFAVVKSSSDPYNDFRTSMVEMIIEKQIFGAKELEQLLQCFLSLNSPYHHEIIVEVFTQIWDALFSHSS